MYENKKDSLSTVINKYTNSNSYVTSSVLAGTTSVFAQQFGTITIAFNNQYNEIITDLTSQRIELNNVVKENLVINPNYYAARNSGVDLAWKYERADIQMGGTGSVDWSDAQRLEILNGRQTPSGKTVYTVRGAEGHHQKNVADHPEYQTDPDNIKFYKDRQEHLQQGHDGNFQNESDADFINKNQMLKRTNQRRVIKNELYGAGIAAAIGFGVGFTFNAIVEMAKVGLDSVEVGKMLTGSVKKGIESGLIAVAGYGLGRVVQNTLHSFGINTVHGAGYLLNYVSTGILTITLFSTYQFVKMKIQGVETSAALRQVGKQTLFSLSVLTVSIIAQGVYGGHAGLVVSTSVGLIFLTKNVATLVHQRKFEERLREYTIEQYRHLLEFGRGADFVVV